ncbi:hypothetical protein CkaCkLH20_05890 [Colletotrichum karsti]|uniref:C3H1-type domain-containing protein n=1 Tax=Colletotrichum karsti TaxID=1095194 RepID=A0A9P6LLE1_9PEZI|nr:uncharacterized protein CkaCkLH20_05890 [Colletotrichum karsti]KAF9876482.1 hypothetical protein CkaCkLH20_05890 [Colletotrichum karsti]
MGITAVRTNNTREAVVLLPAAAAVLGIHRVVVLNTRPRLNHSTSTDDSNPILNIALPTRLSPLGVATLLNNIPNSSGTKTMLIPRHSMELMLRPHCQAPTTTRITLLRSTPTPNMASRRRLINPDTALRSNSNTDSPTTLPPITMLLSSGRAMTNIPRIITVVDVDVVVTATTEAVLESLWLHRLLDHTILELNRRRMVLQPSIPIMPPLLHLALQALHRNRITSTTDKVEDVVAAASVATTCEAVDGGFHKHDNAASGKKKKRKTNTLGLTPGQDSDSEDDEMEEETLRKLIGADALQVTDVAAYIAERKKRFPTAARVKAKKSAEVAHGGGDKFAAALEKEENLASKLRKQLEKVESSIKRKREQQDEGDEMRDSSPVALKSDDDEPEVVSSRAQQAPPPPPPARKADVTKHCKYYSTGGTCGKKGKCRFVHDPAVREAAMKDREANNGQLTIQQRLVLNDKDQEDLTVLQSIQYLRQKGLMKEEENEAHNGTNGRPASSGQSHPRQQSSLPAAPASLPPPPMKHHNGLPPHNPPPSSLSMSNGGSTVRYKGWNLSGYGNSGLKSEDLP